jgi:PST family polysaccharide transporter
MGGRFFGFVTKTAVYPISRVSLSTFSHLQHDIEALKRACLRLSQFMALASLPMFVGLGIVADTFVPLILGPQWQGSIIVMQVLAFSRLSAPVGYFVAPAIIAMGRTRALYRQSIVQTVLTVVLVLGGTAFGLIGVLVALVLRSILMTVNNIMVLNKELGVRPMTLIAVLIPPTVGCVVMAAAVEFAKFELAGDFGQAALLALLVVIGALTYGATLLLGELLHLWPGYIRGAATSLSRAVRRGPKVVATPA